jgi:peptide deformylase
MIYPIVVYGNPVLKKRAVNIKEGEIDVIQLASDMYETMEGAEGIGLAAPQIGKSIRMFVIDATKMEDEEIGDFKQIFINPVIIKQDGDEWAFEEGCLSIPEIREEVYRQEKLTIKYFDENWQPREETYDGLKARIIQHEYDHIEGVLFTDHLTPFKKRLLKGKLVNISKGKVQPKYRIKAPLAK